MLNPALFPKMQNLGCILKLKNDVYVVDELETKKTGEKVKDLLDKLYKKK